MIRKGLRMNKTVSVCLSKQAYDTKHEADGDIQYLRAVSDKKPRYVYHCRFCSKYHITTSKKGG